MHERTEMQRALAWSLNPRRLLQFLRSAQRKLAFTATGAKTVNDHYIRKAIDVAPGFQPTKPLDRKALQAHLILQIRAHGYHVQVWPDHTTIHTGRSRSYRVDGDNSEMNTIKCVVKSGLWRNKKT